MNPDKDPASRPKGMTYWYKENCLKIIRAWLFALGEKKEMPEKEALRIASNVIQFPTPRRLNRFMETLVTQGVIEFFDDFSLGYGEGIKMRLLQLPYEIAQETNR